MGPTRAVSPREGRAASPARVRAPAATLGADASRDPGACSCGGQCPRCLAAQAAGASGPTIARTPAAPTGGTMGTMGTMGTTTTAAPTTSDYRDFVRMTIQSFDGAASFYGDPLVQITSALFDRLLDNWYLMVTDRRRMIDQHLGGDATLIRDLQQAYLGALHVLMPKAATALTQTETDLYRINSGRIPMWAWQTPHRQEAGFSIPLAQGQAVDPLTGNVSFTSGTVPVTMLPDTVGVADPAHPNAAGTKLEFNFSIPFTTTIRGGVARIASFTPPAPTATLQVMYPPGLSASATSGYGRGTTREDIAGGRVDPQSTTLRFHEGNHGLDYQNFMAANPLPAFTGAVGQTVAAFNAAVATYRTALAAYVARADSASSRVTHCVGTTIDQFNQAQNPGARITRECVP